MQWLPLELAFFAVHAVWWDKFKNGGVRERWEELRYPISSETRKNSFASSFIFAKVSLQGKFYDTESKRDGLLEWFDFWTTFLRDEINLPL